MPAVNIPQYKLTLSNFMRSGWSAITGKVVRTGLCINSRKKNTKEMSQVLGIHV